MSVNIISLGNFKIDTKKFFEEILLAKEVERKNIRKIENGERYTFINKESEIEYINTHLITDQINFKNIDKYVRMLLNESKEKNNHLVVYFIDKFNEKIFNESLNIIRNFSQSNKFDFLLLYINDANKKGEKCFLNELNKLMEVNILEIEGRPSEFKITEKKKKEFGKILRAMYYRAEKRKRLEGFSNYCVKKMYSASIQVKNDNLNEKQIIKLKNNFSKELEEKINEDVVAVNKAISKISKSFKIEKLEKINIVDKELLEGFIQYDDSLIGAMARDANKEETITITQKILSKIKFKKGKENKAPQDIEKKFINEAFAQKKRIEKTFKVYENNVKI